LKSAGSCTSNSEANPGSPEQVREPLAGVGCGDALQIGLHGCQALGLDRGLVHEGRVESPICCSGVPPAAWVAAASSMMARTRCLESSSSVSNGPKLA